MTYPIIQPDHWDHCFLVPARKHTDLIIVVCPAPITVLVAAEFVCSRQGEKWERGIDGLGGISLPLTGSHWGPLKLKVQKERDSTRVGFAWNHSKAFLGLFQGPSFGFWTSPITEVTCRTGLVDFHSYFFCLACLYLQSWCRGPQSLPEGGTQGFQQLS